MRSEHSPKYTLDETVELRNLNFQNGFSGLPVGPRRGEDVLLIDLLSSAVIDADRGHHAVGARADCANQKRENDVTRSLEPGATVRVC